MSVSSPRHRCLLLEAPAKINLFLKVVGRRPDGYHLLETMMQKVDLCDTLELRQCAEGISLHCSGGFVPENQANLVYQAADLFFQETEGRRCSSRSGVAITLTKRIPVAAGLGGGSSDAAATLRGLNELYRCSCSGGELVAMGLRLGADVPFFLSDATAALATGIGEVLHPVEPLRGYRILLVNPGFSVSTQWVYETFALTNKGKEDIKKIFRERVAGEPASIPEMRDVLSLDLFENDLETVTASRHPEIDTMKDELLRNGADKVLMTGSGPTVFGLFADAVRAEACYEFLRHRFQDIFLVAPVGVK